MKGSPFKSRISVLRRKLSSSLQDKSGAAWIIQPENRRYLSGFKAEDMQFTELSCSLLIDNTRLILITDSRYATAALEESPDFEVHALQRGLVQELPQLVESLGLRYLLFEEDYLTWGLHNRLTKKLEQLSPHVRLKPLNGPVEEMRARKDALEIKALEISASQICEILDEVIAGLKPGMTERQVAWKIDKLAHEAGAERLSFPSIVASGPNSALPHAVPTDRKLKKKEPIILDLGVRMNGYCSDITRTIFLGAPDPDFKKIYNIVRRAQLAALEQLRPGIVTTHLDGVARQVISDAGFGDFFGHALGHGVGLATHENPRLGPQDPVKLEKGMVVTVEPGIYIPGKGGVRLEETVVVESGGPRILTGNNMFYDF